jgi:hypothetical protein
LPTTFSMCFAAVLGAITSRAAISRPVSPSASGQLERLEARGGEAGRDAHTVERVREERSRPLVVDDDEHRGGGA